ncbi:hypothetical protein MIR68_005233 [Amoeboaphelidium protococcarum]|nr:hypothetical protein MIR68_005233 [Amoeboaphelidium protococcarum]
MLTLNGIIGVQTVSWAKPQKQPKYKVSYPITCRSLIVAIEKPNTEVVVSVWPKSDADRLANNGVYEPEAKGLYKLSALISMCIFQS